MNKQYVRFEKLPLDFFLPIIREGEEKEVVKGYVVGVSSARLRTFKKDGTVCRHCGLEGSFFAIEGFRHQKHPEKSVHVNLWAINSEGEEVLMTSDHIIARSNGGAPEALYNRQTLCSPCNNRKGASENKQAHRAAVPEGDPFKVKSVCLVVEDPNKPLPPEDSLGKWLGMRVKITKHTKKGRIQVHWEGKAQKIRELPRENLQLLEE